MVRGSAKSVVWIPSFTDVAFVLPILFLFGALNGARTLLTDGDTGWHIRAGDWMLRNGRVPQDDFFSYTRAGEPWIAWEWLAELCMAWLHRWGMAALVLGMVFVLS